MVQYYFLNCQIYSIALCALSLLTQEKLHFDIINASIIQDHIHEVINKYSQTVTFDVCFQ